MLCRPEGVAEGEPEPASKRYLLDQVVQTALPEAKSPDEVSTTVKAFMQVCRFVSAYATELCLTLNVRRSATCPRS